MAKHEGDLEQQVRQPIGRLARRGEVEGWLSLILTFVIFSIPASPPLPERFGIYLFSGTIGAALLFALSGVRFGRGSGRIAAGVSLAVLSFLLVILALRALSDLGLIRRW